MRWQARSPLAEPLSASPRALVGATLPEGVSIFPLVERQLKDFDEPERVFELEIDGATPPHEHEAAEPHVPTPPQPPTQEQPQDFGDRLADRIKAMVERSVERSLERATSQVDALADRASKRPETIAERLEED